MGTFNTKQIIFGSPALIPVIAYEIVKQFQSEGFEVTKQDMSTGGCDISITKGGVFKAVLGMKSALKVTLLPQGNTIDFEAGVGIFGQQAIPTIISMFFLWPVLITQIWGMVEQSKLDDKALEIANKVIVENGGGSVSDNSSTQSQSVEFCTGCGTKYESGMKYCGNCGKKL